MKPRHAVLVMLLCVAVAKGAAADKKSLPVSYFERKVDNAPAVGAAAEAVAASSAATQAARDKAGLQLFGSNDLGPHHEVVLNQTSRSYFRYGQEVGVRLPILGARSLQQQDIVQASAAEGIARLDFQAAHLQLVGRARSGYVAYWSARQQQEVAQGFMRQLAAQRSAAFALRKGGFWTSADALAYSGLREAAELDLSQARVDANNALRELSVVTAAPVGPFVPQEPPYATCALSPGRVVPTALATDVDLLKIAVQRAQATQLAALQRWVGYDANVNLGILSSIDAPGGLGYALLV
ncbi:MAG: TolC family protein, partial [Candidatus Eremiobacteraeota bacterium]|nr:TolC family protein [Candidatus Eremiobacteraeota bacterium]